MRDSKPPSDQASDRQGYGKHKCDVMESFAAGVRRKTVIPTAAASFAIVAALAIVAGVVGREAKGCEKRRCRCEQNERYICIQPLFQQ